MLQQTQVSVVILRYWSAFLARFPTVAALARPSLDDVLAAWRGLGYYARARNLHRAAEAVLEPHGGELPDDVDALPRLPGLRRLHRGRGRLHRLRTRGPLVDGNVARVLAACSASRRDGRAAARAQCSGTGRAAWSRSERPGDFNQALMELGATVCRVASPTCLLCPVRQHCQALARGEVGALPPPRPTPARRQLRLAVAVARRHGRLLLARRPDAGLFGGLWELPTVQLAAEAQKKGAQAALRALLGPGTRVGASLGTVRRTLTHRDLALSLFQADAPARPRKGEYVELRWVRPAQAAQLGVSAAMQAALAQADAAVLAPRPRVAHRAGGPRRQRPRLTQDRPGR